MTGSPANPPLPDSSPPPAPIEAAAPGWAFGTPAPRHRWQSRLRLYSPFLILTAGIAIVLAIVLALHTVTYRALPAGHFLNDERALVVFFLVAAAANLVGGLSLSARLLRPFVTALERENARMGAILGSIADGVVLRDPEGHITLANPTAVDLLSTPQGFQPEALEVLNGLPPGAPAVQRIDVGPRTIGVSTAAVRSPDGVYLGDVLVLRDVTAEAIAERTKDSFLDHISHELRTPLTVIKGYVDVIRLGGERLKPEVHERALSAILEQTDTLARMIDDVIDLTGMRSGGLLMLRPLEIALDELVQAVLHDWRAALAAARLELHYTPHPDALTVDADPRRMRRALDALLKNACDFSPEGGRLEVRTFRDGCHAGLVIRDPGVGISAADLPRVFDRFFRGEPVGRDGSPLDVRGVGQGLYTVKTIIEAHGGTVDVDSQLGAGTTFTIRLPLVSAARPPDQV